MHVYMFSHTRIAPHRHASIGVCTHLTHSTHTYTHIHTSSIQIISWLQVGSVIRKMEVLKKDSAVENGAWLMGGKFQFLLDSLSVFTMDWPLPGCESHNVARVRHQISLKDREKTASSQPSSALLIPSGWRNLPSAGLGLTFSPMLAHLSVTEGLEHTDRELSVWKIWWCLY